MSNPTNSRATGFFPDPAWLALWSEDVLEPDLPIVDAHHHLWERWGHRYLLPELLADTGSGHHVTATVFVECVSQYRTDGPTELWPVGETEFADGVAATSERVDGPTRACAGIVAFADLSRGERVREVLEAHVVAGGGRLRGIRHIAAWDASDEIPPSYPSPPSGLLLDPAFRAGFAQLAPLGLSFDAWIYHPQLAELTDLARAFPVTTIVLDHAGGPLGVGPYRARHAEVFAEWKRGIRDLAQYPNIVVKLGGLGMRIGMFDFHSGATPPSSADLARAWRPYVETCIEAFGPDRCMFESNFPVDGVTCSYPVLWNAFKRLAAGSSAPEKAALFEGTARRIYRLD